MKRVLSIILAIAMLLTMLPAVFATDATDKEIYSPVYNFNYPAVGKTTTGALSVSLLNGTDATTGEKYVLDREKSPGEWWYTNIHNMKTCNLQAEDIAFYVNSRPIGDFKNKNAVILELTVDKSGTYTPSIAYSPQIYNSFVDLYLIHEDTMEKKGWATDDVEIVAPLVSAASMTNPAADVKHLAAIDMNSASDGSKDSYASSLELLSGKYYLYAVVSDSNFETTYTAARSYGSIKSITFKSKGTVTATVDNINLKPGETATVTATATDGEGTELTDAAITYSSSDANVVTVDSVTGAISAVGEGEAYIIASTILNDVMISDTVDITVKTVWNPEYVFNYKVIAGYASLITGTGSSQNIQIASVKSEDMIDTSASTGVWTHEKSIGFSTAALYSGNTQMRAAYSTYGKDNAIVLNAKIENVGTYTVEVAYSPSAANGLNKIYLVPKNYAKNKGWDMTTIDGVNAAMADSTSAGSQVALAAAVDMHSSSTDSSPYTGNTVNVTENEFYIVINVTPGCAVTSNGDYFSMIGSLTLNRQASVTAVANKKTLSAGDMTTVIGIVKDNRDNTIDADVTYESSNTSVATVENGVITAKANGTAVITAKAEVDGVTVTDTVEITVTDEAAEKTVAYAYAIDDGEPTVKSSLARGTWVTVEAPEIKGKTFRHWVRGTADKGEWVSAEAEYSFKLMTNTYLTAVYTDAAVTPIVEFFNGNGEYLTEKPVVDGTVVLPENPTLTGFKFLRWITAKDTELTTSGITADITRAVAEFESYGKEYTVEKAEYEYDDPVTRISETDVAWYRDGVQVGYGKEYTYHVWNNVGEITSGTGEKKPIVVLDAAKKGDACMIEYDAGGKEIVEVGILFGDGTSMTVDSCKYKATSQTNGGADGHGQFTAKPSDSSYTYAIGYLIYNDNGTYRVIYGK